MKGRAFPRVPLTAALLYWVLVLAGLDAVTFVRGGGELSDLLPLWAAALLGTGFGQLLGRGRLRPWLVALVLMNLLWFGFVLTAPFFWVREYGGWKGAELAMMTFIPAVLCGYLSLSERGGLIAFWFPAALFMVPILEGAQATEGRATDWVDVGGQQAWLLLAGLGTLFVVYLRARESRRVALWQGSAAVRLSVPRSASVLRQAPLRSLAQWSFVAVTGATALLLTAALAPRLWQKEHFKGRAAALAPHPGESSSTLPANGDSIGPLSTQATCCPEAPAPAAVEQERFKEYFPLLHPKDHAASAPTPQTGCVVCGPAATTGWVASSSPGTTTGTSNGVGSPHATGPSSQPSAPSAQEAPPVSPLTFPPSLSPGLALPPIAATVPGLAALGPAREHAAGHAVGASGEEEGHPLAWILSLAASVLALELLLRPLRRLVTLRHLRSALWPETVDQRVSNLWQFALIGLRDAGFHPAPGEQPEALAARVDLPGMQACALVLERARHGVRVDAEDLELMKREAISAYQAARHRVGRAARALAWLRWPLV